MAEQIACVRCEGSGRVNLDLLEGQERFRCRRCGGQGKVPVSGHHWYYCPLDRRYGVMTSRIALLEVREQGQMRISVFAPDGPLTHREGSVDNGWSVMEDLTGYLYCRAAAKLLDHWSRSERWAVGLLQLTWMAYWNMLPGSEIDGIIELPLPERVREAAKIKARLMPGKELWA